MRASRKGRSRPVQSRRRIVYRRTGFLALALAVPAMAAPIQSDADRDGQVYPIRFAIPEASALVAPPPFDETTQEEPAEASAQVFDPGPAAQAFTIAGSATDRMRAERCMTMAVYYEAASESEAGQRAVAQVVMNRVSHPTYPGSVCGVVFEGSERSTGCQFSFTCDGSLARAPGRQGWLRAGRVARAALDGSVYAPVGLATHYHRTDIRPYWAASLSPAGTIGLHAFYRWRGAAGQRAAFTATYRGGEPVPGRHVPAPTASIASPADTLPPAPDLLPSAGTGVQPLPGIDDDLPPAGAINAEHASSGQWLAQP